jgi:hypothetical protein
MARLFTCGWETGLAEEIGAAMETNATTATGSVVSATPTPRSGAYCYRLYMNDRNDRSAHKRITFASSLSEHYGRFACALADGSGDTSFFRINDSAGGAQITLRWTSVDGLVKMYVGATLTATSSTPVTAGGDWHVYTYRYVASNTTGVFTLEVDGDSAIDYSGDTQATANANAGSVDLLMANNIDVGSNNAYLGYSAFDDVAFNDTTGTVQNGHCGDGAVLLLKPSGNGNSSQLVGSDGNSVDNYALVDDVPASATDYVASSIVGNLDSYACGDIPDPYNAVTLVQPIAYAALAAAGEGDIRTGVRSGGTDYPDAADRPLTTTYQFIRGDVLYVDPADSGAWTTTKVNALEPLVKVT